MSVFVIFFKFEFEQLTPLQSPHPTVQSKSYVSYNYIFSITAKFTVMSYYFINKSLGAGGKFVRKFSVHSFPPPF